MLTSRLSCQTFFVTTWNYHNVAFPVLRDSFVVQEKVNIMFKYYYENTCYKGFAYNGNVRNLSGQDPYKTCTVE
jgi:hypothetical protein